MESDRLIFFTNLEFETTPQTLRAALPELGDNVFLIVDPATNKSRGLAIGSLAAAQAEETLDGIRDREVDGRQIRADYAARSMVFFSWFARSAEECPASLREMAEGAVGRMREAMQQVEDDDD